MLQEQGRQRNASAQSISLQNSTQRRTQVKVEGADFCSKSSSIAKNCSVTAAAAAAVAPTLNPKPTQKAVSREEQPNVPTNAALLGAVGGFSKLSSNEGPSKVLFSTGLCGTNVALCKNAGVLGQGARGLVIIIIMIIIIMLFFFFFLGGGGVEAFWF